MNITLLGTGAADWPPEPCGGDFFRGCCSALVNGRVLVDFGYTAMGNLRRAGVAPEAITALVVTHRHSDHFDLANLSMLAAAHPAPQEVTVFAGAAAIAELRTAGLPFVLRTVETGDVFTVEECEFTVLRANHMFDDVPDEETYNYLIRSRGRNLFYALDTSWLEKSTWLALRETRLDMIVWDCTIGPKTGDWRIFEHCSLPMIEMMIQSLKGDGIVDSATAMVVTHIARTLWPDQNSTEEVIKAYGYIHGFDGLRLEI